MLFTWLLLPGIVIAIVCIPSASVLLKPWLQLPLTFSIPRYYLLMLGLLWPVLLLAYITGHYEVFEQLLVFAVAGVIGETIFSLLWDVFFAKRFWVYSTQTLFNSYTSLLNFLPWGAGGVIFIALTELTQFTASGSFLIMFWLLFLAVLAILLLIRGVVYVLQGNSNTPIMQRLEFKKLTMTTYFLFSLPFLAAVTGSAMALYQYEIVLTAVVGGLVAFLVEYKFGVLCEIVLGKRLWVYQYMASRNGHLTYLSIIPFSLAGFYFVSVWFVYEQIKLIF